MLRDVQANQTVAMDPVLPTFCAACKAGSRRRVPLRPIILNSGYRSPQTTRKTEGAARNSQHLSGKAADIVIPDVPTDYLAKLALYLQGGGVGFYPSKGFVHVDSGNLRVWKGWR